MISKYKRILLKLSGQIISGKNKFGFSKTALNHLRDEIIDAYDLNVELGIVIGGGNVFRGKDAVKDFSFNRVIADYMGMLATLFNASLLRNALENAKIPTSLMSAIPFIELAEPFIRRKAIEYLEEGRIVIFACGTGNPFFTTDTAGVLRALEIESEIILKGTNVKGVYDKDPNKFKDAKFFEKLNYQYVIEQRLEVMDTTAFSLAMINKLPIFVFNILKKGVLSRILSGDNVGSIVSDRI